jgi:protein-L-isoaspartate(D-aspartate) O-methyltransferase
LTLATQKIRLVLELRRAGVTDMGVLTAFERTPRDPFVPEAFADQALEDIALPIGFGQTVSQPSIIARMAQALEPREGLKVLEIGTGSGYQTAILTALFRRVYSIEREVTLSRHAEQRLTAIRRFNAVFRTGDGCLGWPEQAPFDRIVLSAAAVDIPPLLWDQLADDGIMVVPLGEPHEEQRLMRLRRTPDGPDGLDMGPVRFVPLVAGAARRRAVG